MARGRAASIVVMTRRRHTFGFARLCTRVNRQLLGAIVDCCHPLLLARREQTRAGGGGSGGASAHGVVRRTERGAGLPPFSFAWTHLVSCGVLILYPHCWINIRVKQGTQPFSNADRTDFRIRRSHSDPVTGKYRGVIAQNSIFT